MVNFTYLINIEREFDYMEIVRMADNNWRWSFYISVIYLAAIFILKNFMRTRQGLDLKPMLILWNGGLAIFSIVAAQRMLPDFLDILWKHGAHRVMCSASYKSSKMTFWIFLFTVSKLVEFGDTVFIILRKRPLLFLHWYHHATVFLYTYYGIIQQVNPGICFIMVNLVVHSCMYTYYMLMALKIRIPRQISMVLTMLQLMQMVIGVGINVYTFLVIVSGGQCSTSFKYIAVAVAIYLSYFILFLKFFNSAYLTKTMDKLSAKED